MLSTVPSATFCEKDHPGRGEKKRQCRVYSMGSFHRKKVFCCLDNESKRSFFLCAEPSFCLFHTKPKLLQVLSAILSIHWWHLSSFCHNRFVSLYIYIYIYIRTHIAKIWLVCISIPFSKVCCSNCTNNVSLIHIACIQIANQESKLTVG